MLLVMRPLDLGGAMAPRWDLPEKIPKSSKVDHFKTPNCTKRVKNSQKHVFMVFRGVFMRFYSLFSVLEVIYNIWRFSIFLNFSKYFSDLLLKKKKISLTI